MRLLIKCSKNGLERDLLLSNGLAVDVRLTFTTKKNEIEEKIKIEVDLNVARLVPKPTTAKSAAGNARHDSIKHHCRCVRRINSYSANKSVSKKV
jgi:hypothetical protein